MFIVRNPSTIGLQAQMVQSKFKVFLVAFERVNVGNVLNSKLNSGYEDAITKWLIVSNIINLNIRFVGIKLL